MTDVSIITTCYHGQKYLDRLTECIEKNAFYFDGNIELILVNDSPDEKIVPDTYEKHFKIKVFDNKTNSGIHKSRINGLLKASGKYIKFLDQDDLISRHCISDQHRKLLETRADVLVSNALIEGAGHLEFPRYRTRKDIERTDSLTAYRYLGNQISSPGQCLIKKDSVPDEWIKYPMQTNGADDYFLWLLMMFKGMKFAKDMSPVYKHVYTGENLSDSTEKMLSSIYEMAEYLEKISYIDKKYVKNLVKAREYEAECTSMPLGKRLFHLLKNLDMSLYVQLASLKLI